MERPELDSERIAVSGKGVTGLVVEGHLHQARRKGPRFFTRLKRQAVVHEEPELAHLPASEARDLRRLIARAERALYTGRNWRRYLDEASAVDYVLLQELLRNADGFKASTFMVKGAGRRLGGAIRRNFTRWPVLDRQLWRTPSPCGSHRAEVAHLRRWLARRIAWMDRVLR